MALPFIKQRYPFQQWPFSLEHYRDKLVVSTLHWKGNNSQFHPLNNSPNAYNSVSWPNYTIFSFDYNYRRLLQLCHRFFALFLVVSTDMCFQGEQVGRYSLPEARLRLHKFVTDADSFWQRLEEYCTDHSLWRNVFFSSPVIFDSHTVSYSQRKITKRLVKHKNVAVNKMIGLQETDKQ